MFFLHFLVDWDSPKNNQNSPEILHEYLDILAAGKLDDEKQELPEHKLVNTKNKGGLWKVTAEVFEIFCIAKQIFKKRTETCSNKIDKAVLEDTGVLANFSKWKSNINYADDEITKNSLEDLIHLYVKTRTFSLVRSRMESHKLLLRERWGDTPVSPWNFLRRIQKQLFW